MSLSSACPVKNISLNLSQNKIILQYSSGAANTFNFWLYGAGFYVSSAFRIFLQYYFPLPLLSSTISQYENLKCSFFTVGLLNEFSCKNKYFSDTFIQFCCEYKIVAQKTPTNVHLSTSSMLTLNHKSLLNNFINYIQDLFYN